jgi:hypothetical protein
VSGLESIESRADGEIAMSFSNNERDTIKRRRPYLRASARVPMRTTHAAENNVVRAAPSGVSPRQIERIFCGMAWDGARSNVKMRYKNEALGCQHQITGFKSSVHDGCQIRRALHRHREGWNATIPATSPPLCWRCFTAAIPICNDPTFPLQF